MQEFIAVCTSPFLYVLFPIPSQYFATHLSILFEVRKIFTFMHSKSVGSCTNVIWHQIIFLQFVVKVGNPVNIVYF